MHLWDLKVGTYPWLTNPEVEETPFANIKNLAVDYLLPDYCHDTATVELAGLVHVEAAWDPTNPVAESKWLAKTLADFKTPYAIIAGGNLLLGHTDLKTDSVAFMNAYSQRYEDFLIKKGIITSEEVNQFKEKKVIPEDVNN